MVGHLKQHSRQQADHVDSTLELLVASATAAGLWAKYTVLCLP